MRGTDELSRVFAALADPTRRNILTRLRGDGVATVGELAADYDMSRPAVSQHLRVLTEAGLIIRDARAQYRECRLADHGMDDAQGWIERNRADWSRRLDDLGEHLAGNLAERRTRASAGANDTAVDTADTERDEQ